MNWNEKLQEIIDYVENHLQRTEEPVDTEEIARMAGCSFGFFQKVFSYMNGISFAEYVRFRKMTLAGYDLKSTDLKVIDISYKYGYDSPTSFTKAFQQFHGMSPKEARRADAGLRVWPKMQIASREEYSWRLEQKNAFRVIGKSIRVSTEGNQHYRKIPEFWSSCQRDGTFARLASMDSGSPKGMFGIFGDYDAAKKEIVYSMSVVSQAALPPGFIEYTIPAAAWAVFDCRGPVHSAIQGGWKYLNEEWLIKYPFAHAECPELEWYSEGNSFDEGYLSQIWIPVLE